MKRDIRRRTERAIIRFFEKELLTAAAAIKEQGRVFFPEKPDPEAVTYYTPVSYTHLDVYKRQRGVLP